MQPTPIRTNTTTATPQGRASLFDSLDTIKNEYELLVAELGGVRNERDELEVRLNSQMTELNTVRSSLYELEIQHSRALAKYEDEGYQLQTERSNLRYDLGRPPETSFPTLLRPPQTVSISGAASQVLRFTTAATTSDITYATREHDIPLSFKALTPFIFHYYSTSSSEGFRFWH
ncbi:hypothetical protein BJ912DRAFT_323929 [Pholiota molesta]|nr:hypothetical protein BJ912DRAFT_323929 [Pholiota molesta]